jgi:endoglucanase
MLRMSIKFKRMTMVGALGAIAASLAITASATVASGSAARGHASAYAQQCSDAQYPPARDPANPLALATSPGPDPLHGAKFFVDGPRHGYAAGAIAQLMGVDPMSFTDDVSWSSFVQSMVSGPLSSRLHGDLALAHQVSLLAKIAAQPEAQRFSLYSGGGGPGAIFGQVQKILCHNLTADPGSIPIVETFFIYPNGQYCPTLAQLLANQSTFMRQIDELAAATGRHPTVYLLELDSIGASACLHGAALALWEHDLAYEINAISALPHVVAYTEAGYSDANSARYTAKVLNAIGVNKIRGFFTNDTHINWTSNEMAWGMKVSKLTHGARFIVNTAQNGKGPLLNPHPVTQGIENLCNPPGRGLGPMDTTTTGFAKVDGYIWTHVPGRSSGSCNGGPPPGDFWLARAISLAQLANQQLGLGYLSRPY